MCIFVKSGFFCHQGIAPATRWRHQDGSIFRNVHKANMYKCTNFHVCNKKYTRCRLNDWTIRLSQSKKKREAFSPKSKKWWLSWAVTLLST